MYQNWTFYSVYNIIGTFIHSDRSWVNLFAEYEVVEMVWSELSDT